MSHPNSCTACELHRSATQAVVGIGNANNPHLLILGEAPGATEDEEGVPFVGPAGQELQDILCGDMGLTLDHLWITNVAKHRPPGNRTPTPLEAKTCYEKWLRNEIAAVNPTVIIALGRCAGEMLIRVSGKPVTKEKLRGKITLIGDRLCFNTWHPSYVIRQQSVSKDAYMIARSELLEDCVKAFEIAKGRRLSTIAL